MARRALSPDEVKALGLPEAPPQPTRRALTPEEVAAAGLPPQPAAPVKQQPGVGEALARGYAQGGSLGFADELSGAAQAAFDRGLTRGQEVLDGKVLANPVTEFEKLMRSYRANQDAVRREDAAAKAAHPVAYGTGDVAGGVVSGLVAPAGKASSIIQGATSGLGRSEAKSLAGDAGNVALGGALGYAGDLLGRGIGKASGYIGSKVGDWAGKRAAEAEAKAAGMAAEKTQAAIASMRGELGAATQDANRAVEVLTSHLGGSLTPAQRAELAALEQSGVLPALKEKLADSVLAKVPNAAANIDAKRLALDTAMANKQAATDAARDAILSGGEAKAQVLARLQRYAPPLLGTMLGSTAGAAAGMALGGDKIDAATGALAGAGVRPAVHAMRRMVQHPAVQHAAATTIQSIAEKVPHLLGEYAPILASAAARGPGALAVQDYVLTQSDPSYREKKAQAQKSLEQPQ